MYLSLKNIYPLNSKKTLSIWHLGLKHKSMLTFWNQNEISSFDLSKLFGQRNDDEQLDYCNRKINFRTLFHNRAAYISSEEVFTKKGILDPTPRKTCTRYLSRNLRRQPVSSFLTKCFNICKFHTLEEKVYTISSQFNTN